MATSRLIRMALLASLWTPPAQADVWVAPDGSDDNPGTRARPLATVSQAQDAVREMRKTGLPKGGVTVWLRGGTYGLKKTLAFGSEDSGAADAPIVYRAVDCEDVWLSGGVSVPPGSFVKTTDPAMLSLLPKEAHGHVVQLSLESVGIADWVRELPDAFGGYKQPPPFVHVYCDGKRMQWARWPNEGFDKFTEIVDTGSGIRDPEGRRLKKLRPGISSTQATARRDGT